MGVLDRLKREFSKERRLGREIMREQAARERAKRFEKFRKKIPKVSTPTLSQKIIKRLAKPKKYQGKTGKRGRGRPRGSYKYFIPGRGPVSVFEWRRYLSRQKQLMKMRTQQLKARQQIYSPMQQQMLQQQINQQMLQQQGQPSSPAIIPAPQYERYPRDLKVWEEMPGLGLNPVIQQPQQMFYETDLATGRLRLRKGGSLL